MAKVRTLSRKFMKGHPLAGCPTQFVESFLNSLNVDYLTTGNAYYDKLISLNNKNLKSGKINLKQIAEFFLSLTKTLNVKKHTIRGGNHFKASDKISIRCWLDKPYNSPQIILWEDLEVKKVWDFHASSLGKRINNKWTNSSVDFHLATNDGLELSAFNQWFNNSFEGQIISWSESLNY